MAGDLATLIEIEKDYRPNTAVSERLKTITMGLVIGPVAVGKSTCIDKLVERNPERFGRVKSFTTRPRRVNDPETQYEFLPHNETTFDVLKRTALARELVQFSVHPTTHYIYGSGISTYDRPYMLLDVLARHVPFMRELPFKNRNEVTVVAWPREWLQRFLGRLSEGGLGIDEAFKRLDEGTESLQFSLAQGPSMAWVHNVRSADGAPSEKTINEFHDAATGYSTTYNSQALHVGFKLLEALTNIAS